MSAVSKKLLALTTVIFILLNCFCVSVAAVESDVPPDNGNMELDIVFVLDSSGSMLESDPNRVAADAFGLFTDLCDDSCGIGYTVYSEKIKESEKIAMLDKQHLADLKQKIAQMNTNPYGDTDIALGLSEALKIHNQNTNTADGRKKAVILLSDGNTHLIDNSKSDEQLKKEMDSVLTSLNENEIPVYAIGLNYDGTLDKNETQKIASATHGKSYETKSSDELPAIIADIFADIYQITGSSKDIVDGNVEIFIKDKSVFYVNIVIRSRLTIEELNPVLLTPRRESVDLSGNDENFKMTYTGSYTLIKMIYPASGRWKLHLDNATNQNCIVTQLDFYSVFVKQTIHDTDNTIVVGQDTTIEASLNSKNGIVTDKDLISTISMTATISGNGENQSIELTPQSNSTFTGTFTIPQQGTYTIITTAQSDKFQKSSVPLTLTAKVYTDEELQKIKSRLDDKSVTVDTRSLTDTEKSSFNFTPIIIIVLVVALAVVIGIVVMLKLKEKNDQKALSMLNAPKEDAYHSDNKPKPAAPPIETAKPSPQATDPEYVNIPLVEHGSLESLIRKGPDDAFHGNSDDYKVDESLEALIRKGPDNNLGVGSPQQEEDLNDFDNTHDEGYQSGHNLSDMLGGFDDDSPSAGGVNLSKK